LNRVSLTEKYYLSSDMYYHNLGLSTDHHKVRQHYNTLAGKSVEPMAWTKHSTDGDTHLGNDLPDRECRGHVAVEHHDASGRSHLSR
jgi:hypothetical protein